MFYRDGEFLRLRNEITKMLCRLLDFRDSSTRCDFVGRRRLGTNRSRKRHLNESFRNRCCMTREGSCSVLSNGPLAVPFQNIRYARRSLLKRILPLSVAGSLLKCALYHIRLQKLLHCWVRAGRSACRSTADASFCIAIP